MSHFGRRVVNAIGALVVLLVVALMGLLLVLPRVTGAVPLTVLSGSMEPTIPVGSAVFIRPVDPATVQVGDVITYQAAPGVKELITHRVTEVQPDTEPPSFITKGDANRGEDLEPVPVGAVRGEVWFHVPYVGQAADLVHGPRGWAVLAMLGGVLIAVHLSGKLLRSTGAGAGHIRRESA